MTKRTKFWLNILAWIFGIHLALVLIQLLVNTQIKADEKPSISQQPDNSVNGVSIQGATVIHQEQP